MSGSGASDSDGDDALFSFAPGTDETRASSKRSRRDAVQASVASSWRGSRPLEKREAKRAKAPAPAAPPATAATPVPRRAEPAEAEKDPPLTLHVANLPKLSLIHI